MRAVSLPILHCLGLSGVLLAVGCATPGVPTSGPSRGAHAAPTVIAAPERFVERPVRAARATFGPRPWWETIGDRDLDRLVKAALAGNLGLREAATRVAAAEASLRQAHARLFPTLDGSGQVSDRWGGEDEDEDEAQSSLGALLAWEADLFGRLRAARTASERDARAARADLAGGRLLISATVAETHVARLEQLQQLALLGEQAKVGETLLDLTRLRFGQGQASIVDVLQQEEQLQETRALEPIVRARIAELGYALDALLGRPPGRAPRSSRLTLPDPPPLPPTGLPSDLLLRRPDLVAVQERIAALDARVSEALADRLPRLQLTATSALESAGAASLVTSLAAAVIAPLFDAGAREAEVARRRALLEGAVADFGELFLAALRDVESALANDRQQAERLRRQESQLETAKRLLNETRNRYSQGLTEYLPVLAALTTVQQLERDIVTTRRDRISQRIALHRALGGPMD